MDSSLIAPVIAATVSILALAVTNVMNFIENRKNRRISVIIKQTIANKDKLADIAATILALTNPLMLNEPRGADVKKEILTACAGVEVLMRTTREEGLEVVNAMRALVKAFFEKTPNAKKVQDLHKRFREIMSTYDSSYWSYIKQQSDGKRKKKGTLASTYKRKIGDYENAKQPEDWI